MTIQFLLTVALVLIMVYAQTQRTYIAGIAYGIFLAALGGLYLVWAPDHANIIARALGVGRGTDLLFYLWAITVAAILLNLHIKMQSNRRRLSLLVREIALARPYQPPRKEDPK